MKHGKKLLSLLLALTLTAAALPSVGTPFTATAAGLPTLTATTADDWSALFDRRNKTQTWLGADGIYSVAIDGNDAFGSATSSTKTFFIFSDSLMGTSDANGNVTWAPGQPSQTSAVLTGNTPTESNMRFVWGKGGNGQFGSDQHLFGEHKWMLDCFVVGSAVYIFGFPEQDWKPKQIDMIKIPIENGEPAYSKYSKTAAISDLWYRDGDTYLYAYGIGVTKNTVSAGAANPDGYIYIYGYRDAMQEFSRKDMIVSRIKESDFPDFTKTTYWNGSSWSDNIRDSAPIVSDVSCEFSVTPITSGPYKDKWIAVYTRGTESPYMMYAIGDGPAGPFRNPVCFYEAPEHGQDNGGMYTYNAKAHPHLSSDGKLLISYNCNNRNAFGRQTTVDYHPRFLWLDLDPLNQGDYGADDDPDPNIAYSGTAVASTTQQNGPPINVIDGDNDTTWNVDTAPLEGQWIGVTWDEARRIDRLLLKWNANRPIEQGYRVEITQNGSTWTEVNSVMSRAETGEWLFEDSVYFPDAPLTAKGVRIVVTQMVTDKNSINCREFEVYSGIDTTDPDIAHAGAIIASSETDNDPRGKAADGDVSTYWNAAEGQTLGEWIGYHWNETVTVDSLLVQWGIGRPSDTGYTVQISNDGSTWTDVAASVSRADPVNDDQTYTDTVTLTNGSAQTKYVRILVTEMATNLDGTPKGSVQCREFKVYGETEQEAIVVIGDADCNGTVTAADLTRIARHAGGIEWMTAKASLLNSNADGATGITASDITFVARILAKLA